MAINGAKLRVKIWLGNPLVPLLLGGEETTSSISFTKDSWESTSKKSAAWRKRNSSYKSAEITLEAFVQFVPDTGEASYLQIFGVYNGTDSVKISFTDNITGDTEHVGMYHITKLDVSAPNEQGATISLTLTSDGTITGAAIV